MLGTFVAAVLLWTDWHNRLVWICLITTLLLGLLGFWDDYEKVAKKNSKGVSAARSSSGSSASPSLQLGPGLRHAGRHRHHRAAPPSRRSRTPVTSTTPAGAAVVSEVKLAVSYRSLVLPGFRSRSSRTWASLR